MSWLDTTGRRLGQEAGHGLLIAPFAVFFFAFQIAPMIWVMFNAFYSEDDAAWGLANFREILAGEDADFFLQSFSNSFSLSFWTAVAGLVIAAFAAASIQKVPSRLREWMISFTNMTSNFAGVPLAFAFVIILGFNGSFTLLLKQWGLIDNFNVYGMPGLILIYTYFQIPLGILLLFPAFDALKPEWEEAAFTMGATRLQYWLRIAVPVLLPALLGTLTILFANAMGAYASAYALTVGNYNLATIRIGQFVSGDIEFLPNMAAAMSMLLVVILAFFTVVYRWLLRRSYHGKA
ncbi:MAG: ABC transporter permease subunit [Duodenibacillus sp.]|nr:ABC transporter permease subunit [Duodenibacillus sp.]